METYNQINTEPQNKRPVFLLVLGILTFVNSGFGVLSSLLAYLSGPISKDGIEKIVAENMTQVNVIREQGMPGLAGTMETMVRSIQYTNDAHYIANTLNLLVYALAIIGVILMFRARKLGFHLYIISCLVRICAFYVYIPAGDVSGFLVGYYMFTSILFIFMYSRNLKWMR